MIGRNGVDDLGQLFIILSLISIVISQITRSKIIYLISIALVLMTYFRILSRDLARCRNQNREYQGFKNDSWGFFQKYMGKLKLNLTRKRQYKIFKCPSCRQKLRIPRRKGKIEIGCTKCRHKFIKRT